MPLDESDLEDLAIVVMAAAKEKACGLNVHAFSYAWKALLKAGFEPENWQIKNWNEYIERMHE